MRMLSRIALMSALLTGHTAWGEPLVIYGPGAPSSDLATQALKVVEESYGATIGVDRLVHVNEVPFPAAVPLWMMGDAEVIPCRGAAITAQELEDLLARAEASEGNMEWDEADKLLDDATAALSCSGEMIDADLLWRLFFIHGAIAYFDERTGEAQDHFRMSLGVDPSRRFDPNYPPQIQAAYLNAREELQLSALASIRFVGDREGTTEICLDGAPLPVPPGGSTQLHAGYHLLQFRTRLEVFYSVPFKVKAGGEASLVSGNGYSEAILAGDSVPHTKVIAIQALTTIPGVGESLIYIVNTTEDASSYQFDPATRAFERPPEPIEVAEIPDEVQEGGETGGETPEDPQDTETGEGGETGETPEDTVEDPVEDVQDDDPLTPAPTPQERRLGITVGGGPLLFFGGGDVGRRVWAGPSLVITGRLARGLYLEGGFQLGLRSNEGNLNIFPAGRIGIRPVFTSTAVRPFAAGLFLVGGGSAETGPRPGGAVVGGVMFEPGAKRSMRITLEVGGGYLGGGLVLFNVRLGPLF